MATNKREVEGIDESFLLSSIKEQNNPEKERTAQVSKTQQEEVKIQEPEVVEFQPELPKEGSKKRGKQQEYEALFIKEANLPPARFGKTVYIRKEYHDRISQIIHVIGGNEVSLFGYIDNVLAHHFETFQEGISQSYKKNSIF
ncbi:hypothetical protein Barb7_01956 [Bacteroidales bacterium Barb7]|nr:hypothetical protein Barb7_01956 [Bacteroidales bacterium Barb7]